MANIGTINCQLGTKIQKKQKLKNQYSCFYCFKRFPKRSNARDHIMIHYELKPFVCRLCGKAFRQKGHHKYHVTHVHQQTEKIKLKTLRMQQVVLGQKVESPDSPVGGVQRAQQQLRLMQKQRYMNKFGGDQVTQSEAQAGIFQQNDSDIINADQADYHNEFIIM